jgi:hypothetical protein
VCIRRQSYFRHNHKVTSGEAWRAEGSYMLQRCVAACGNDVEGGSLLVQ